MYFEQIFYLFNIFYFLGVILRLKWIVMQMVGCLRVL